MGKHRFGAGSPAALLVVTLVTGCGVPLGGLGIDPGGESDAGSNFGVDAIEPPADDASSPDDALAPLDATSPSGDDASPGGPDGSSSDAAPADATPPSDGSNPALVDARPDDDRLAPGDDGGGDSGCGPTDTVLSCGACGVACDTLTGAPSCDGTTCRYQCGAGLIDCNGGQAPDTDGCECATPACCGDACQTIHADGVGASFYDCLPPSTYTQDEAFAACAAHAGGASYCGDQSCSGGHAVCDFTSPLNDCTCWGYDGDIAGHVYVSSSCVCPLTGDPSWN
jgi:hypothetical protein